MPLSSVIPAEERESSRQIEMNISNCILRLGPGSAPRFARANRDLAGVTLSLEMIIVGKMPAAHEISMAGFFMTNPPYKNSKRRQAGRRAIGKKKAIDGRDHSRI